MYFRPIDCDSMYLTIFLSFNRQVAFESMFAPSLIKILRIASSESYYARFVTQDSAVVFKTKQAEGKINFESHQNQKFRRCNTITSEKEISS